MEIVRLITAGNHDPKGPPVHENNVWLIGDDREVIVIDPAHDAEAVMAAVTGREIRAVLLTHGHWDHVRACPRFQQLSHTTPWLRPEDRFLWEQSNDDQPFQELSDGQVFEVAGAELTAIATPGHTPGSTSFWFPEARTLFTGDTLFEGGPGATRWDYSSFETILDSIARLFPLGDDVTVNTGHGPATTIGAERPHFEQWRARGW